MQKGVQMNWNAEWLWIYIVFRLIEFCNLSAFSQNIVCFCRRLSALGFNLLRLKYFRMPNAIFSSLFLLLFRSFSLFYSVCHENFLVSYRFVFGRKASCFRSPKKGKIKFQIFPRTNRIDDENAVKKCCICATSVHALVFIAPLHRIAAHRLMNASIWSPTASWLLDVAVLLVIDFVYFHFFVALFRVFSVVVSTTLCRFRWRRTGFLLDGQTSKKMKNRPKKEVANERRIHIAPPSCIGTNRNVFKTNSCRRWNIFEHFPKCQCATKMHLQFSRSRCSFGSFVGSFFFLIFFFLSVFASSRSAAFYWFRRCAFSADWMLCSFFIWNRMHFQFV